MTEEAQPPQVERAADETPAEPAGHAPRYHEPSYTLPAGASTPSMGAAGQPGTAGGSEWARPTPAAPASGAANPGPAWPGASVAPTPVAPASGPAPVGPTFSPAPVAPTSGPAPVAPSFGPAPVAPSFGPAPVAQPGGPVPVGVRGAATGAAYPFRVEAPPAPLSGYPGAGGPVGGPGAAGGGRVAAVPAPPRESLRAPSRVDAVPGTPFGLVHLEVASVISGPAVASLVTGAGSVLVAFAAGCFGLAGSSPSDWGGWVAGAFAVLAGLLGLAGLLLGELGRRQTSPGGPRWPGRGRAAGAAMPGSTAPPVRFSGRGLAIAGLSCAGAGLALTVVAVAVAVLLQLV